MKGIIKKVIAIVLLLQIFYASLAITPASFATEINMSSGTLPTEAVGEDLITTASPTTTTPSASADPFSAILDGLAGILVLPVKIMPLIVGKVLTWIMNAVVGEGLIGTLSVADILFNNVTLTGVNFFELNSGDSTVDQIRKSVSIWYYSIRNLAAVLLIVIIVYVGIRMALSTIAEDKAKYKQMLIDWITGLALLFVLHYLMVAIVNANNILVDILKSTITGSNGQISDTIMDQLFSDSLAIGFTQGLGSALCYVLLVGVTFLFLIAYVKRMITIAFLIVIAPLVTVTYSIDKMGDSKSQALNTWLKEFSYNILIQPFQCVTYLALGQTAITVLQNGYSLKAIVIAIAMLIFVLTSEKIIKHIFHFESQSMSDTLASAVGGATLISLASKAKSGGGGGGKGGGGGGNNKFADPQKSMTTASKGSTNVRQGGNSSRPTPSGGGSSGGSGTGGSGTGSGPVGGSGAGSSSPTRSSSGTRNSRGALGAVGNAAGKWLKTGLSYGTTLTGAMLGLGATGSIDKGMIQGGMLAGGAMSKRIQKSETNKRRRNLARAYNNYANTIATQNPNFTADQVNAQVRQKAVDMLTGNVQGPLTDDEKALQAALRGMAANYEKNGMSEEDRNEALNNDFNGIETGAISETSAPMRFAGNIKSTASRINNARRSGRWGFGGQGRQQGQRQPRQTPPPRRPRQTPPPPPTGGQNPTGGSGGGTNP